MPIPALKGLGWAEAAATKGDSMKSVVSAANMRST